MEPFIRIRGARQHNLKNLDLDLPRGQFIVVTGPSGSGKSSLALDTVFAEGQRRYVESLSTYAKQFLERMEKPDVDRVDGVSPAVAIEQKNPTRTSRSSVGTATEVLDYLRLLFARVGHTHCPKCGVRVLPDSATSAGLAILALPAGTRFRVAFPLPRSDRTVHAALVENLRALGFVRIEADGRTLDLALPGVENVEASEVDLGLAREILVVVDRLKVGADIRERLADSLETAFREGEGEVRILLAAEGDAPERRIAFTERFRCADHPEVEFPDPTPQLFSFNSPYGSCPECTGFGATLEYDLSLILPNPAKTLAEGAVDPWMMPRYRRERDRLEAFAEARGISVDTPWEALPEDFQEAVLHGAPGKKGRLQRDAGFQGVLPFLRSRESKRYKQYIRVFLRRYQSPQPCRGCGGARLRPEALNVRVGGWTMAELSDLPLDALAARLEALTLTGAEAEIAALLLREIRSRVSFLVEVGLGYLTLNRQTRTLSGGEAQRINLSNALGARLVDTLYVLDEPSIGLHPRDTEGLLRLLHRLRDLGNTVLVVEHDPEVILAADQVLELGPASGERGGERVFQGPPAELLGAETVTGRSLRASRVPRSRDEPRRRIQGPWLRLLGARLHNVDGVDLELPLGTLTAITGVSGSGKSTLIHDILLRALERAMNEGETSAKEHLGEVVGEYRALEGIAELEGVVRIDQSPIGRTPRSNPVTYIKAWDDVRRIYAAQPLARQRGFEARHFSFNVAGGRCEACAGAGRVEVEMIFLADVFVPCDVCRGRRFRPEVLDVRVRGLSISDALELTVDEAIRFFLREDRLGQILWHLQQVGLGYLRLGQSATTLSGGEAQRLKIARELAAASGRKGRKLYLLDEPTTGLAGEDVRVLLGVLAQLVNVGHTVVVIEHNLDLIRAADWVVDMGPGAGAQGGRIVAQGRPEEVARNAASVTGRFLRPLLDLPGEATP
jgi:excinuclease ABC subunit A